MTLAATSDTCTAPLYQFWEIAPGGGWTMIQDYGVGSSYAWDTSVVPDGTYEFEVWVKDSSSSSPYDAYMDISYTIQGSGAPCTAGTATPSPSGSASAGTLVTITGAASTCANAQFEFWELAPGGGTGWTIVQPWGSNTAYNWDTTSAAFGSYEFEVWIRDETSEAQYDTYADFSYTVTPSGSCNLGTSTVLPSSPQNLGTPVVITGAQVSCGNPTYQFYELAPGGNWTIVQPYGPSNTYNWDTSTATSGTYEFEVWIRDASSSAPQDTYTDFSYQLTGSFVPCRTVVTTPTPASPQTAGTPVSFGTTSASCGSPTYEVWEHVPGGGWTIVQPWGPSGTYAWDTTTSGPGSYEFEVWARDAASTATYDAYTDFPYVLQ